ncbi:MAG TPA: hypothetical protein VKV16_00070 [Solirubrobacteraceae bacterium]|nr:hypothetical protein [Solirubrobacteraceae bacterium]
MRSRAPAPLILAFVALALLLAPATAAASDASATQRYVHADYALVSVARSHLKTAEDGPLQVLEQVRQECPGAGAGSPQNPESTQMSDEVIGAMVLAAARPDVAAIRTFVASVHALQWPGSPLTGEVRAYAAKLQTLLALVPPNLCGDVRAWAADDYRALPASTVAFVAKFMPAWVALGYQPAQLRRFESAAARALARRALPLEEQLTEGEARAVEHWGAIMDTLQLWP